MALKMIIVFDIRVLVIIFVRSLAALGQLTVPLVGVSSHNTCSVAEQHKKNLRSNVTNTLR